MERGPVKVIETSVVTDAELERIINEALREGWVFDGMHFAMRDNSRRPAMAFLIFYDAASEELPRGPRPVAPSTE